ncbi:MAG: trypsin-like peptidase domain-containing protein [Alphaproteobacteria bacterium]|nr:trypsin-like peptidase domain-containing protein [Alphaproteobacteria bacterium]
MHNPFGPSTPPRISIPQELENKESILAYLDVNPEELKKIWWFREKMYQAFEIQKRGGKARVISAPDDRLKYLQHKILLLLNRLYRVRNPVHGFVPQKSVKTNATAHLRKRFILNIDLKDFFPSITENRIIGVLKSIGIDDQVAQIISRICCSNGCLPQGAPTSPVLSNIICFRLDKNLMSLAKDTRCIYTRYADDLTFSSHQPMIKLFEGVITPAGHVSPELLSLHLRNIFLANGFIINPDKVHYADRNSRRMVTGLKVNEFVNLDRRYIRNIRAILHSIKVSDVKAVETKYKQDYGGKVDLGKYLRGKITWLGFIRGQSDPIFRAIAIRFNEEFPDLKIETTPTFIEIRDRAVWVIEYCVDTLAGLKAFQGSCFFLKDVGLVTAAHCVLDENEPMKELELELHHPSKPANKFKAKICMFDKHRDLAILSHKIPATEYYELELSTKTISVDDELTAVGYPSFGPGDQTNIKKGTVSSLPKKSDVQLIEVTQKLAQGMSGGPLHDSNFAVVGVIHKGGPSEGRDFAVHFDELNKWLSTPPISKILG